MKNKSNINLISIPQEYPVVISLSLIFSYTSKSLVDILQNPKLPFVSKQESEAIWENEFQKIYMPLFQFLCNQNIKVSIIVTGHFLDVSARKCPEFIDVLKQMLKKDLLYIIPDAYWGSSHLSMYYFDWWKDEIAGTIDRIKSYLSFTPKSVYLPILYRQLPLEKLLTGFEIENFVSIVNERKGGSISTSLKSFRRFRGGRVTWIREVEQKDINLHWYAYSHYFDLMNIKTHKNIDLMTKSIALEIALTATKAQIINNKYQKQVAIRIQEERNWSRYSNLEKGIFRLWEYATYMLGKEHAEIDTIDDDPLMRNLFYSMNRDFFYYVNYHNYNKKQILPFTSPYESFIHIQNTNIQLEILLKQRES
ncbi:MAG: hypothetical protein WD512_16145 [Candidatus Paceibacterota bacterium]